MEAFIERKKVILLKIVFVLTVIGTLIAFQYDHNRIMSMNTTTTAIVTDFGEHQDNDHMEDYWVKYEFTIHNKKYSNTKSTDKKYEVGDSMTIHYNPKKPKDNCITISYQEIGDIAAIAWFVSLVIFVSELLYINGQLTKKKWNDLEEKINTEIKISTMFIYIGTITIIIAILSLFLVIYGYLLILDAFISIIVLFYFIKRKKALTNLKNDKELFSNLRTAKGITYSGIGNIYFTDEYICDIRLKIQIIKYEDIDEIECITHDTSNSIAITTKNKKIIYISEIATNNTSEIIEELQKRTPHLNQK